MRGVRLALALGERSGPVDTAARCSRNAGARSGHARGLATAARGNNLVFLGAPGVGKGTFAGRIAKLLGVPAVSTGDIIRAEIKAGSELGRKVQTYSNAGQLVPDEVVTAMVKHRLSQPDAKAGYILVRRRPLTRAGGGCALTGRALIRFPPRRHRRRAGRVPSDGAAGEGPRRAAGAQRAVRRRRRAPTRPFSARSLGPATLPALASRRASAAW